MAAGDASAICASIFHSFIETAGCGLGNISGRCCLCGCTEFDFITRHPVHYPTCPGCKHTIKKAVLDCSMDFRACRACCHSCTRCSSAPPKDLIVKTTCEACGTTCSERFKSNAFADTMWIFSKYIIFPIDGVQERDGTFHGVCRACGYNSAPETAPLDLSASGTSASETSSPASETTSSPLMPMEESPLDLSRKGASSPEYWTHLLPLSLDDEEWDDLALLNISSPDLTSTPVSTPPCRWTTWAPLPVPSNASDARF